MIGGCAVRVATNLALGHTDTTTITLVVYEGDILPKSEGLTNWVFIALWSGWAFVRIGWSFRTFWAWITNWVTIVRYFTNILGLKQSVLNENK